MRGLVGTAVLAVLLAACALPIGAPDARTASPPPVPPKVLGLVDLDEEEVCAWGYCDEDRLVEAVGVDADRYRALAVAPLTEAEAQALADDLTDAFIGVWSVDVSAAPDECPASAQWCVTGEYFPDDAEIVLYEPTVGTLLHEVAHHLQWEVPYRELDEAKGDFRDHSDGFEWALVDVYEAYLALPIDHDWLERAPDREASYVPGDCLEIDAEGWIAGAVDCAGPHDAEVFATLAFDDGPYPADDDFTAEGDDLCAGAFAGYVGRGLVGSEYAIDWYGPSEDGWVRGHRELLCLLVHPDGERLVGGAGG